MKDVKYKNLSIIFLTIFILFFLLFLGYFNIVPYGNEIPYILLLGVSIILCVFFFIFMNINQKKFKKEVSIKLISENIIKLFFLFLIFTTLLIPPIINPESVILWKKVPIFNLIRAILIIFGLSYLPGSCIY